MHVASVLIRRSRGIGPVESLRELGLHYNTLYGYVYMPNILCIMYICYMSMYICIHYNTLYGYNILYG